MYEWRSPFSGSIPSRYQVVRLYTTPSMKECVRRVWLEDARNRTWIYSYSENCFASVCMIQGWEEKGHGIAKDYAS